MDPAGPGFTDPYDYGTDVRLDPSDAEYVQITYTSMFTLLT